MTAIAVQVSNVVVEKVENAGELERKLKVVIPADELEKECQKQFKAFAKNPKLPGFQAGKPLSDTARRWVKKEYGAEIRKTAVGELIENSLKQVIKDQALVPADMPTLDSIADEIGKDLEYTVKFEIMPEFELADFSQVEIEDPKVEISEKDIDEAIERLRKRLVNWKTVDRAAANGDRLLTNFKGLLDGIEEFEHNSGEDVEIVLGENSFIEGFEAGLEGLKAGDKKELNLKFPSTWEGSNLAGRSVTFNVEVTEVFEEELPEVDDIFATRIGIPSGLAEDIRKFLREDLERSVVQESKRIIENQLANHALTLHENFSVPKTLVNKESAQMLYDTVQRMQKFNKSEEMPKHVAEELRAEAEKRMRMSLILNKIIQVQQLKLDEALVQNHVNKILYSMRDPKLAKKLLNSRQDAEKLHQRAAEAAMVEQIYDFLGKQVKHKERICTVTELFDSSTKWG